METTAPPAAPASAAPATPPFRPHPLLALVLAFPAPGLGHLYAGRLRRGLAVWVAAHALLFGLALAAEGLPDGLRVPAVLLGFLVLGAISGEPTWIYFSRGPEGVRWGRIGRGVQARGDG